MSKVTNKLALLFVIFVLVLAPMAGCTGQQAATTSPPAAGTVAPTVAPTATPAATTANAEPVTLKFAVSASSATSKQTTDLVNAVNNQFGDKIKIEPLVIPGKDTDFDQKMTVSLMAGDEMDIFYANTTNYIARANASLVEPLDDLIASNNYDIATVYGSNICKYNGHIYFLPSLKDLHVTLYNKDLFDAAKIPYPDNATWTWDKYVEDAKAITSLGNGIYGSYMIDWDTYFTFSAKQKKVSAYKADGTSRFDDPAWADSIKFFADLGNVDKVQPDFLTWSSQKMQWDAFLSTGKYGMFVVGEWALGSAMDLKTYPRTWKLGVAIMPQVNAGDKTTLSIKGGYAILSTSKHQQEAFEVVKFLAENIWKTQDGTIPALNNLTDEQQNGICQKIVDGLPNDGITVDQLKAILFDPATTYVDEKVVGKGMSVINNLIPSEGELYATGQKSLEDTMKELKEKADKAIAEDK